MKKTQKTCSVNCAKRLVYKNMFFAKLAISPKIPQDTRIPKTWHKYCSIIRINQFFDIYIFYIFTNKKLDFKEIICYTKIIRINQWLFEGVFVWGTEEKLKYILRAVNPCLKYGDTTGNSNCR